MDLYFNDYKLPNVISCQTQRITRNTRTEYNADGDMLIDLVSRKYNLVIHLGGLSSAETQNLFKITDKIFFKVSFESPVSGSITADFHMREQTAETNFVHEGVTYYKTLKLVLEER